MSFLRALVFVAFAAFILIALVGRPALGAEPPPASTAAASTSTAPKKPTLGLAVVAIDGATDAAWALAREVYANASLRPASIDDAHARALAGEAPAADAPPDVRDLAQIRAAVKGDDPASRQLLGGIASQLGVRGVIVVEAPAGARPSARVFVAETGAFDAARYTPDDTPLLGWHGAVQSLARSYVPAAPTIVGTVAPTPALATTHAPTAALRDGPRIENSPPPSKKFYESAWFWGAIGAAVFAGGAIYFATRDNSSGTIHLQLQAPK